MLVESLHIGLAPDSTFGLLSIFERNIDVFVDILTKTFGKALRNFSTLEHNLMSFGRNLFESVKLIGIRLLELAELRKSLSVLVMERSIKDPDLVLKQLLPSEVLREHSRDSLVDDVRRVLLQEVLESLCLESSRVAGMMLVDLISSLSTSSFDVGSIDDDNVVSDLLSGVGSVSGLVLALNEGSSLLSHSTKRNS